MMSKKKVSNVFISHYEKDDEKLQKLKQRLSEKGYNIRNYSVDSTKHTKEKRPSDEVIRRFLRKQISWSGAFICLIGEKTHTRRWVNDEIEIAHKQGKRIIGIYTHGNNETAELPVAFKKYGSSVIGWNSLDKLIDIINGKEQINENPDSTQRNPLYQMANIKC